MRTEAEVKAQVERARRVLAEHRAANRWADAAIAAVHLNVLSWVLGATSDPTHRSPELKR